MLLFITPVSVLITSCAFHFNTSHVTVYLDKIRKAVNTDRFQYISCYCLSRANRNECKVFEISIHLMLLFIHHRWSYLIHWIQFQYISCYCLSSSVKSSGIFFNSFQYISCYCLSVFFTHKTPASPYFNTSHVTVYRFASRSSKDCSFSFQYISCYCLSIFVSFFLHSIVISIHLMLLFIRLDKPIRKIQYHFNTSHVTVYPIESDTFMPGL